MEIEWKFLADSRQAAQEAVRRCAELGWAVSADGFRHITDTYYDTPRQDILTSGSSIRKRVENGKTKLTAKGPSTAIDGQPFRREEHEGPVEPRFFEERGLRPVLTVRNRREVYLLRRGEALVELALDTVYFRHQAANAPVDYQVELELKSKGGEAEFLALGEALKGLAGLHTTTQNKYRRGMELTECWRW